MNHGSESERRLRILACVPHFLPGIKAGGPIRSLAHLVEQLGGEFEFSILTADRDLGDDTPFPKIEVNRWQHVGLAQVCYLSPAEQRCFALARRIGQTPHDILYLNGLFNGLTRRVLLLRRCGVLPRRPTIVAPRGEFSPGALRLKYRKKRLFLAIARVVGLCRRVFWHATSDDEAELIRQWFGTTVAVCSAPNLPSGAQRPIDRSARGKQPGAARIVLLGRVSRMKNVDFALRVLAQVRGDVEFRVLGPREDREYDAECAALAERLPAGVRATFVGGLPPDDVWRELAAAHLMFLPTRGENFGHAIIEALRAACPVLISDQTPWCDLEEHRAGWVLPLDPAERFRAVVQQVIDMPEAEWAEWSAGARRFGEQFACNPAHREANRQLFLRAAGRSETSSLIDRRDT